MTIENWLIVGYAGLTAFAVVCNSVLRDHRKRLRAHDDLIHETRKLIADILRKGN